MQALAIRIAIFLVALVIVLTGMLYVFAQFVRRTSMFSPDKYPNGDWTTTASDVTFKTGDGVGLHGWLFRASGEHAPLLVWMHGNAGNITDRAPMASELARRGVTVLLFDWRGYGKSEGTPSEDALYLDALAAVDFARSLNSGPLCLYGESLGGPYAAYAASLRPVRCVVIENSFPSLTALGNALYRPFPLGWFAPRAMTTLRWLNAAHVPVLVMHGRRDEVIPFALGKALFDGLTGPKEMLVSETAGHCQIPTMEGARYYDVVTRFVKG